MRLRAAWLYERRSGWLRRILLAPLVPVSRLYGLGARLHRRLYTGGWRRRGRLACRVVSVGNLVVGGSGKTPAAAWLAEALHRRGHKVAIASRGYGRRTRDVRVVSDGRHVQADVERTGDEPLLLAAGAPGVPVLVGPDRARVGLRAISVFGVDVLLLDDGFQHHRLERDVDVVLVDGGLGLGNRAVLPRGPLREPLAALRRADAVGVVDGPLPPEDEALLERTCPDAFRFRAVRRPVSLRSLRGGPAASPGALAGCDVGMLAGIARPAGLARTLRALGARVVAERTFPDHHRYRARDLDGLSREASHWVTTAKDAVKVLPHWAGDVRVDVLSIALAVEEPDPLLEWLETRLR